MPWVNYLLSFIILTFWHSQSCNTSDLSPLAWFSDILYMGLLLFACVLIFSVLSVQICYLLFLLTFFILFILPFLHSFFKVIFHLPSKSKEYLKVYIYLCYFLLFVRLQTHDCFSNHISWQMNRISVLLFKFHNYVAVITVHILKLVTNRSILKYLHHMYIMQCYISECMYRYCMYYFFKTSQEKVLQKNFLADFLAFFFLDLFVSNLKCNSYFIVLIWQSCLLKAKWFQLLFLNYNFKEYCSKKIESS